MRRVEREAQVNLAPDAELTGAILASGAVSFPKRESSFAVEEDDLSVPLVGETSIEVPDYMEVTNGDPEVVAEILVSCFPRVSGWALRDLTLKAPDPRALGRGPSPEGSDPRTFWPVFVNPTRACYRLFRCVALPLAPTPAYALEMLARSWRRIPSRVLEGFLPTTPGGSIEIERSRYERYFAGPLDVLSERTGVVKPAEKNLMIEVLRRGVLPCFAVDGESAVDRMVSSTLALSFAACGLRLLGAEPGAPRSTGSGSGVFVTQAGLIYFAAWYVLVYAAALHAGPAALRVHLSRVGTDADKLLCNALTLGERERELVAEDDSAGEDLSCGFSFRGYKDRNIARALLIVFEGLLDTRTVLRAAQLYASELTTLLPYLKSLEITPDSVRSAIEARDVWLETLRGGRPRRGGCEPPFVYVGDVAYEMHSSVRGALSGARYRRIARPPPKYDDHGFDPWYGCLVIADSRVESESHEVIAAELAETEVREAGSDKSRESCSEEYIIRAFEKITIQQDDDERSGSDVGTRTDAVSQQPSTATPDAHPMSHKRVCDGLYVVEREALGFNDATKRRFLCESTDDVVYDANSNGDARGEGREVQIPCMGNIAYAVYAKAPGSHLDETDAVLSGEAHYQCATLLRALWVLLKGVRRGETGVSSDRPAGEPSTVEALAVMIHLAVKSFRPIEVSKLNICNDVQALYADVCGEEEKFIPVAAMAAGLFGLNVQIYAKGCIYRIVNQRRDNAWPLGFLEYKDGAGWGLRGLPRGCVITHPPSETSREARCDHPGTYRAYTRLNRLKVITVASDGYCGFHAIATLLAGRKTKCGSALRAKLAEETALFVFRNSDRLDVAIYLAERRAHGTRDLALRITEEGYWLDVQDVKYILEAHGRQLELVTENSHPIYTPGRSYVLIKDHHFEPLLPV